MPHSPHPTLKIGPLEVSVDQGEGTVMVSLAGQGLALVVVPAIATDLDGEDARYWIDGSAQTTEPVPPTNYLVAAWPNGEDFERLFVGDLGVGPEGEGAKAVAEQAVQRLRHSVLEPYERYLTAQGVPADHYTAGADAGSALRYGAVIAQLSGGELDPMDHEGEFYPAADAGFAEVAERVATLLAKGETVTCRVVAKALAAERDSDELARLGRTVVVGEEADGPTARTAIVEAWEWLTRRCAEAWLVGKGYPAEDVEALDDDYSEAAVQALPPNS